MSCHIQFEQWVPFPLERVFAFFSNPENLPRIMPASTKTQIIRVNLMAPPAPLTGVGEELTTTKAAGVGSIIVTSFHVFPFLPIRAQWTSRITESEWNHHFADVQDKGPFKNWHGPNVCGIQCPYSLSDFFNFNASPSSFTAISAPYGASTFLDWTGNPQPPDNDGDD